MHRAIGAHCCTAAVAMGFTGDLNEAANAEVRPGGCLENPGEGRYRLGAGGCDLIQARPVERLVAGHTVDGVEPAPAFPDLAGQIVIGGVVDLEKSLRPAFI